MEEGAVDSDLSATRHRTRILNHRKISTKHMEIHTKNNVMQLTDFESRVLMTLKN